MSSTPQPPLLRPVLRWYADHHRDLPWRADTATPWGVFVSEVMSQQTPVARVAPVWQEWMRRWPTPHLLAAESPAEVIRAWGRLGYPRRALRLHEAARAIVSRFGGTVPSNPADLQSLPGVGAYTAAAVACFAFGVRVAVVDTNVRRVLARAVSGVAQAAPSLTRAETELAASLLPAEPSTAAEWNVGVMELGALVCTATDPHCAVCPLQRDCAWLAAGAPPYVGPARRVQRFTGTDRQVRGLLLGQLRDSHEPVSRATFDTVWPDDAQRDRALSSLIEDGLVEPVGDDRFSLPG